MMNEGLLLKKVGNELHIFNLNLTLTFPIFVVPANQKGIFALKDIMEEYGYDDMKATKETSTWINDYIKNTPDWEGSDDGEGIED